MYPYLIVFVVLGLTPPDVPAQQPVSFRHEVLPLLTKSGCNSGTCHGTPTGKNGFHLSLRGFNPTQDFAALTRENASRRVNLIDPGQSLILRKASGGMPHEGGMRFTVASSEYRTILEWIQQGAKTDEPGTAELAGLSVHPPSAIAEVSANEHRFTVRAKFSDGSIVDVTDRCRISLTDSAVASIREPGVIERVRRGEVTVAAEFAGGYATATVLFPSRKTDQLWTAPPPLNRVDEIVFNKLKLLQIQPAADADDATFLRRIFLDLTGSIPTSAEVREFLADQRPTKRNLLIERLLESPAFADWWAMKWTDRLGCNQRFVGKWGALKYHAWIRHAMDINLPEDEFVRTLLTASGPNYSNPPSGFWRRLRVGGIGANVDPLLAAEEVSQLFLGVRIQCARCHNHPGENWTQNDYYGFAAFFPRLKFKDGPYVNHRYDKEDTVYPVHSGEVTHPITGTAAVPTPLGGSELQIGNRIDRRVPLADWVVNPNNPFFAKAAVNRIWFHLLGKGLVDPVDDFRSSNPPRHPELLEWLAGEFVQSGFDRKQIIRKIVQSRTYQLASESSVGDELSEQYFASARVRILGAEQLLDAIQQACQVFEKFPGMPLGTRAISLPDGEYKHPFLEAFGRPARAIACECERELSTNFTQALHLVGGKIVDRKVRHEAGLAAKLANSDSSADQILEELYLSTLNRRPSKAEADLLLENWPSQKDARRERIEDILWSLLNHPEFVFQH